MQGAYGFVADALECMVQQHIGSRPWVVSISAKVGVSACLNDYAVAAFVESEMTRRQLTAQDVQAVQLIQTHLVE